jgi:imidazolonepropionase
MKVDLLLHSAAQLVTCASPNAQPKRDKDMRNVGMITNGAIAIADGHIVAVGDSAELRNAHIAKREINVTGKTLCPGFVDPHTHIVYGGDRVNEFELRINGASYMEILAAGGGIVSTMQHTRSASLNQLLAQSRARLDALYKNGVTTCEIKTGYGLNTLTELKMLQAIEQLAQTHPCDVMFTLLAAHTTPPEYKSDPTAYVDLVVNEIIPTASNWFNTQAKAHHHTPLACDVFCENHAFNVEQSRRILTAGKRYGMTPKIHVDQFTSMGGVEMALELGVISCDHLDVTTPEDRRRLAQSSTVAVVLPAVTFNLGSAQFAHARQMIDEGCAVALSTDMNPGSAPCLSPALVMAIACRYQRLLPSEALNASTINAAHALGIANRVGSIEVGKQADILIIDAPDYRHLAYQFGVNLVKTVIKNGKWVDR